MELLNPLHARSVQTALNFVKNPVKACDTVYGFIQELNVLIKSRRDDSRDDYHLYYGETWDLMQRRWSKLEKDFRLKSGCYDISKIPDIYDCIKYDLQHNQHVLQFPDAEDFYKYAKALADLVIPQEYGITQKEKLTIGLGICSPLLKKIRSDLLTNTYAAEDDESESVNRLNPHYSHGVSSPGRHVRTRLYFTSESHIHSLLNVLRLGGLFDEAKDEQWRRAMDYVSLVSELNYMTQIVIMLYEDQTKDPTSDDRFHVELHFSPGVVCCLQKNHIKGPGFRPQSRSSGTIKESPTILEEPELEEKTKQSGNDNQKSEPIPITVTTSKERNNSGDTTEASTPTESKARSYSLSSSTQRPHSLESDIIKEQQKKQIDKERALTLSWNDVSGSVDCDLPGCQRSTSSLFSTAVISGSSSAPNLQETLLHTSSEGCSSIPTIRPLETLHNALSLRHLESFLEKLTASQLYRLPLSSSSMRIPINANSSGLSGNHMKGCLPITSPTSSCQSFGWSGPPSFVSSSGPSSPNSSHLDLLSRKPNDSETTPADNCWSGGLFDEAKDEQWRRAMDYVSLVSELNYMTQIVIMLYEDQTKDPTSDDRFHVELHFSPGVVCCLQKNHIKGPGFRPQSRSSGTIKESPTILEEPELEEKTKQSGNDNQKSEPIPITVTTSKERNNSGDTTEASTPTESKARSYSLSSSTQRPHSLESDIIKEQQKKQIDKERALTLSWNDVSGSVDCDLPGCQNIYDCIKYDLQHNQHVLQFPDAEDFYKYAKALADLVIPQEYGITQKEKLTIGLGICSPLLKKIRSDLLTNTYAAEDDESESVNRLNPHYSHGVSSPGRHVRTRLYFTSESHIHSLLNVLRLGGLFDEAKDEQWRRAMDYVSLVSELNYMTQIVIMLYEDQTKDPTSDDRFHVELHFSPGVVCCLQKNHIKGPGFRPQSRSSGTIKESPTILEEPELEEKTKQSGNDNQKSEPIPITVTTSKERNNSGDTTEASTPTESKARSYSLSSSTQRPHSLESDIIKEQQKKQIDKERALTLSWNDVSGSVDCDLPGCQRSTSSLFSTAVISGSSSAPNLQETLLHTSSEGCSSIPTIRPLETLHNALSLRHLESFLEKLTASQLYRLPLSSSSMRIPINANSSGLSGNHMKGCLPITSPTSSCQSFGWSGPPSFVSSSGPSSPNSSHLDLLSRKPNDSETTPADNCWSGPPSPLDSKYYANNSNF
ncbi:unnamed protein product [Medioppia subpectinata]|uniref:Inositol hexakisphosphate and diphosphoinositol-pentakisphosphate kinase n=1 Tax=Medioppia subpectinata TaxID=1979941 RepID=A0A7R9KJQ2_9ACAR|nr:unnamed protein product [Medioppia subpectinata]CAG2104534.1 unnamed protein product [Medioppia subpectinata]